MSTFDFFLRTKLQPPRATAQLVRRPRLTERLRANIDSPVTLVAADAGWGKTTLISDLLSDIARPRVWYQLDHTDADPIVFLNYLARGLAGVEPKFGNRLTAYLAESGEEIFQFPERAADLFVNEILDTIEQPVIVVLDDYHHLGNETIVHKVIDRILQYSSELLHLIITTRDIPPLAVTRRKTQSAALVIGRNDLLFNDEEIRTLFHDTLDVELNDREVEKYRDRTQGWITALQLVRQVAEREPDDPKVSKNVRLLEILERSERDIFDYFAEEVLLRESPETQQNLLYLAIPPTLPLDQASLIFPFMRCSSLLPMLAQKNVFLTVSGTGSSGEIYRFHPLFRDFLLRRLRSEISRSGVAAERIRIGEKFIVMERSDLALPYLIEAEAFDRAAEVVATSGSGWIANGLIVSLSEIARSIPIESLERFPRSLVHIAEVARLQGDIDRSTSLLRRAVDVFDGEDASQDKAEALHSLSSIARRRSNIPEALELLDLAEKLAEQSSETYIKCLNTRGLCYIASGNWNEAEHQFRLALELAEARSNDHFVKLTTHNLALAPGFRGDFGEALRWLYRMFAADRHQQQLPQDAIGHLNVARLHIYRGEFEHAERNLENALTLSQLYNLRSLLPEIFEAYGNFHRDSGDNARAAEFYERASLAYDDAGIEIASRELNEERAKFLISRGDTRKARGLLESLIEIRGANSSQTARTMLCRVDLIESHTDGVADRLLGLIDQFRANSHYYDEALAQMTLAEVRWAAGEFRPMADAIERVLDLASRFDYEFWLKGEIRRRPDIFNFDGIQEKLSPDLREQTAVPVNVSPIVEDEPTVVTDLTIRVLGPAEIYRNQSVPLSVDAWTTRRARDIFCFIATSRDRRVSKDILIETFWPDQDLESIEKNFHPTISHIRKALNKDRPFKQNFINFREGSYQLNPDLNYSIDSEEFERLIADAANAKRGKDGEVLRTCLESAAKLYRGEFMSGVYENWADERRQFYSEQYERVQSALAKLAFSEQRWASALGFAREVLKNDPYREDIHRLVMKTLAAQHKPGAVKKHFDEMCRQLSSDLGIDPSAETKRLFKELIG